MKYLRAVRKAASFCAVTCALSGAAFSSQSYAQTINVNTLLSSQEPTFVHVDRCNVDFDVPPVIVNGRTFVEANAIFQKLNIQLSWRQSDRRITGVSPNGNRFHLWIGRNTAELNGRSVRLDAAPFIGLPQNRTMVPLSFVGQATGARVNWRSSPRTVDIVAGINQQCTLDDLQDMVDLTYRGYLPFNEAGPFSITPVRMSRNGQRAYLVTMSGTDLARVRQAQDATGIYEDLLIGFFNAGNSYTSAVYNRIMSTVPAGSRLILAGHSLGGMVAQQIASDNQIKNRYQVLNTVTFGSPLISAGRREGDVRRVGDNRDLVPLLSLEGTILLPWQVAGLNRRNGGYGPLQVINAHLKSYRRDDVWAGFDAFGFNNGSNAVTFNPSDIRFYPAPR